MVSVITVTYSPPREEGWLRGQLKKSRSHLIPRRRGGRSQATFKSFSSAMPAADHSCVRSGSNDQNQYRPRNSEESLLYRTVAGHLETFLARQQGRGREVPQFVEREMRAYLSCGVLACGFLRLQCRSCGKDRLLPLSCKGRSVCPSCCGRRMADTAAHLVDSMFPHVPVRQWVLSLPFALRYRLARNSFAPAPGGPGHLPGTSLHLRIIAAN